MTFLIDCRLFLHIVLWEDPIELHSRKIYALGKPLTVILEDGPLEVH